MYIGHFMLEQMLKINFLFPVISGSCHGQLTNSAWIYVSVHYYTGRDMNTGPEDTGPVLQR